MDSPTFNYEDLMNSPTIVTRKPKLNQNAYRCQKCRIAFNGNFIYKDGQKV